MREGLLRACLGRPKTGRRRAHGGAAAQGQAQTPAVAAARKPRHAGTAAGQQGHGKQAERAAWEASAPPWSQPCAALPAAVCPAAGTEHSSQHRHEPELIEIEQAPGMHWQAQTLGAGVARHRRSRQRAAAGRSRCVDVCSSAVLAGAFRNTRGQHQAHGKWRGDPHPIPRPWASLGTCTPLVRLYRALQRGSGLAEGHRGRAWLLPPPLCRRRHVASAAAPEPTSAVALFLQLLQALHHGSQRFPRSLPLA